MINDHASGKVIWTAAGRDADTAAAFFTELGPERAEQLAAVSMDMSPAYAKAVTEHAPQATICWDPFHVVALANKALDEVRRAHWNTLRAQAGAQAARKFKGARWALRKRPENLTERQAGALAELERAGGRSGGHTSSRRRYARSSPATWTKPRSLSCSTAGCHERNAAA